jgi:heme A synthase
MHAAPRGEANKHLLRFRHLLTATIFATFALIVIGGIVRVSDSGLGCGAEGSGTKGWPLCGGRLLPFLQEHQVIEFSHRVAATVIVILIGALAFMAFRHLRERRWLVRGVVAAGILVIAQAILGGLTVEHGLHTAFVAAHLGMAMLLLGLLITLRRLAQDRERAAPLDTSRALRWTTTAAVVLLFLTIIAGGTIAGTEEEGTPGQPVIGAHLACGTEFPTCLGKFMPFSYGRLVDIQLTHRLLMYLTAIAVLAMTAVAVRRRVAMPPDGNRAFLLIPLLLVCQILLGAINVWEGKHAWLVVSHLTLATILWGTVVYAAVTLVRVPEPVGAPRPEGSGSEAETQAVAA